MMQNIFYTAPWLPVPLLALFGATLVFVVWIIAAYRNSRRRLELEVKLKQDMLNRGMSAADIERVIRASVTQPTGIQEAVEPPLDNEAALIKRMLDDGHEVEDIERLVRALRERTGSTAFTTGAREMV